MQRLTRFVLGHRALVCVVWVIAFVVGGAFVQRTTDRLTFDFSLPGQPGYDTAVRILHTYGTAAEQPPYLLVVRAPGRVDSAAAEAAFARVAQAVPQARIVGRTQTGDPVFVTPDGHTEFAYAFPPLQRGFASPVLDALGTALHRAAPPGTATDVTGLDALAQSTGGGSGPGVLAETLIGGLGALAVLAFVFASMLALLPLLIAAVAILTTFLVLLGVTYITDISFIVQFLVSLIGLGVAIDYSLLIVTRWREERDHGRDNREAVIVALDTAGRAVVFSGLTVAIGLVALVVIPVPFLRSIGIGGMLIPLVSVTVATTLLPALLGSVGPWVDRPRIRHEVVASRGWSRWARLVVRRRALAAGFAALVLVALAVPFLGMQIGTASSSSLTKSGPAYDGLQALEHGGAPHGVLTPMLALVRQGTATGVAERLRTVPEMAAAAAIDLGAASRPGTDLVLAVPVQETSNAGTMEVVRRARDVVASAAGGIGLSGVGPLQLDYNSGVYGNMPLVIGVIVVITFVLLARAFRSLLLPVKAVLLNLLSMAATFGAVVLFWQDGHGSQQIFGIAPTGAITFWLPIMIFAFLFGLSMDYEVFILSRIREEYDRTGDTDAAVIEGVGRTGRLVTSAALILFLAFLSLASGPETDIKTFATALGFGILLDATAVRMLLVPALVALFGRWNWYLPRPLAWVLRVEQPAAETRTAA